ncbi:MAG: sensor histidine kinase [Dehalococcoidia bacterium]
MLLPGPLQIRLARLPAIVVDAALASLVVGIGLLQVLSMPRRGGPFGDPTPQVEAAVLITLAGVCLLVRSRFPAISLVGVGAFSSLFLLRGYPFFAILPAFSVALYSAVALSTWSRPRILTLALAICAVVAASLEIGEVRGRPLAAWAGDIGWVTFAILLGEAMRSRREVAHEAQLRAIQAELTREEEARRRVSEERLEIARELHDIVAHNLALINVQAGVAAHVLDNNPQQAREAFITIKNASHTTLQELRSMVRVLRDPTSGAPALTPTVGLDALDQLIASIREAGIQVEVEKVDLGGNLTATVDLAAYRILQEALTNVVKHAANAPVRIQIEQQDGQLTVRVLNGPSQTARPAGEPGSGLAGMRERVAALGGSIEAGPLPDGGFQVRATLPVSA